MSRIPKEITLKINLTKPFLLLIALGTVLLCAANWPGSPADESVPTL